MGKLTKEKIDSIYRLFDEHGYSYKEIMAKVGCSKPTLVRYLVLRKKGSEEVVKNKEIVTINNGGGLDEYFKLVKDIEIFKQKLEGTESWLEEIETDNDDDIIEINGSLKQIEFLKEKLDEKNIDLVELGKLYKLYYNVIADGNKIINMINEKRKIKEKEERKRLEREKNEELERKKKEEEDSRRRILKRKFERYYSYSLHERRRMVLKEGGIHDREDIDGILVDWIRFDKTERNIEFFKSYLKGFLPNLPKTRYDYIIFWWQEVCLKD